MLSIWSLRRVLLAGENGPMLRAMQAALLALGARPVHPENLQDAEAIHRALREGRFCCVIAPDLSRLCQGDAQRRLAALDTLLFEMREAGVPLAMLLTAHDAENAPLLRRAEGMLHGACGDPVNVLCLRHTAQDAHVLCRQALELGARFLAGERTCAGMLTLAEEEAHTPARDFLSLPDARSSALL